jgi:hypothetical protein
MDSKPNRVTQEPDEVYHANREFIGSSELRRMEQSPKHFHTAWKGPRDEDSTEAQEIGKFLHSLLLERDITKYVARPVDEKGALVRSNSKEYAAFLAANAGKNPIHPDIYNKAKDALASFQENQMIDGLIRNARIENSVYAIDHHSGLKVKARPDIWGPGFIVDLKSTKTVDNHFERAIFANRYDFQLAHYAETIKQATGEIIKDFYILAFERQAPYGMKLFKIPKIYIDQQAEVRKIYLDEIAACQKVGQFPGFKAEIIEVHRPNFMSATNAFDLEVS